MVSIFFLIYVSLLAISNVYSNIAEFDCFEQADVGPGKAYFERYAWNAQNKTCKKFVYGGLTGNRNNFQSMEECIQSCRDAILNKQLNFDRSRQYKAINRLYENFQMTLNIEQVDNNYFKLTVQPDNKLLSVSTQNQSISIETESVNGDERQYWYLIPTGEQDYYRIKTRSKLIGHIDYLFLQVIKNGTTYANVARRNHDYLGQQWKFV